MIDTLDSIDSGSFLRSDADDTTSGHLTLSDSGYSIGNEFHVWKRNYVVNSSNHQELLYEDGNSLPAGGSYRFTAHISATGTDNFARAVYWNQNGTWKLNVTYQSGTSSNHPEFILSSGVPTIATDHSSNYTIHVLGERIELNEGTGGDNRNGFGADGYFSSTPSDLRYNRDGSGAIGSGDLVWHGGNDGTGSGLDADKLDGVEGSSFLRSDADDTATGQITLQRDSSSTTDFSLHIRNQQSAPAQIKFSNNSTTQNGFFNYRHEDSQSNSAGNSFHFNSTETSTAVIIDQTAGNSGFYVGTNRVLTEADFPSISTKITATGGSSTSTVSGYKVHDFQSNGTFEITAGSGEVEVLIVGGGGSEGGAGSGCHGGGGGGGGGVVNRFLTLGVGKYAVVVGAGGLWRNNGGNSSAFGLVALGGGAGGPTLTGNGNSGGSGGGASRHTTSNQGGSATQPSSDAGGLGNAGGNIGSNTNPGGGGGAGGAGNSGSASSNPGFGGPGKQFTQFGVNIYFGAGGHGNGQSSSSGPEGQTGANNNGAGNTGAGGGGSPGGGTRYYGGSGRVMIRYAV